MSQKALAAHLGLSPSTISLVLNDAPLAAAIPEATRKRIFDAARELDYRPDLYARYLFSGKSFTVAVMLPEIGEGFSASILNGVDEALVKNNYAFFLANHHGDHAMIGEFARRLSQRAVEGFIVINTPLAEPLDAPVVSIGSQAVVGNVVRIQPDNHRGAHLAAVHLMDLGHKQIAVMRGHHWRPASEERWLGVREAMKQRGLSVVRKLVTELTSERALHGPATPEEGYRAAQALVAGGGRFTALICFNDFAAIGAMRALHEAGLRVPEDVSVVGFDDVQAAAYTVPGLTTLRQPWHGMGARAGAEMLRLLAGEEPTSREIVVAPELIVRETTAALR